MGDGKFNPEHDPESGGHRFWVRLSHWIVTASFVALLISGVVILMAHPRLYWGEVGNDLTPALFELPVGRNFQHGGWANKTPFFPEAQSPVSASRTYNIFNQNGWGRSLHFLAAWLLVLPGLYYGFAGILTGHFRRHLLPRADELRLRLIAHDMTNHLRFRIPVATGGPHYSVLQKFAYCGVIFVVLPVAILTGLAMSPAIVASYPFLSAMFGGAQSARTIHFFAAVILVAFVVVHVTMIVKSGFKRQMQAMTVGK